MTRWPTRPLGELVSLEYGKALKAEQRSVRGRYPVYGSNGIVGSYDEAVVKEPTIVLGRKGAVGEAHLAEHGCWPIDTAFYTIFRQPGVVLLQFLLLWFRSVDLSSLAITATIPGLNRDTLYAQQLPVPPLAEQQRIVKLLDEADGLRKLRAQADRRTADLVPALFHEMFGDPTHLERMRWPFKSLGEFSDISYGLADKLDASTKPENGTRILTISNVLLNGSIDTRVEKYSVVEPARRARARLQRFDLLFNWRNGSEEHVGKTAIWEEQVEGEILHVSFLLKIRANQSQANPYFLWMLLNRLRSTGYFTRNARMQINRKFNASELSALKLPLPPLPLQTQFAKLASEVRKLEAEQDTSRRRSEDLFQSLLHRAFQGEL